VTVTGGVSGPKIKVPPLTPGPVPPLPAMNVRPGAKPRLWVGILVPLVSVIAALSLISLPEHTVMFPSVVVMAATAFRFTSRPALNKTLPLTVVIAALTLMSRPQHTTKFPFVAVTALLMFTSRPAVNVSVVVLGAAVQLTASLTLMSPWPGVVE
jgi:hypothetical protein